MIYLTLDSDVWLNSLKESGEEDNFIDLLELWIENGNIQILLPENVIEEWKRNRENKKQQLIKDWKAFFTRAKKFFASDVIKDLKTPEHLNKLVENQLKRVEAIFDNHAIKIPILPEYKIKAAELAEHKKAPFGQKNSIGDAYIFLAITDYIHKNSLNNCVFVTNNYTDFSHKDCVDKIHPDLEAEFTKCNIAYFIDIRRFFYEFSTQLSDIAKLKKQKILSAESNKLTNAILNPQTIENSTELKESYIDNINHLNLILKAEKPTKQQVIFALSLVDADESYKTYFFTNIENRVWFRILYDSNVFNPENNPSPQQVKNGIFTPLWLPILYLEKLSNQIKNGIGIDLVNDILKIIVSVSENPRDNYRTWYSFITILRNLPNEKIPNDIFKFIPTWLKSRFDSNHLSAEICKEFIPKFLSDSPFREDIEKAETILEQLFVIERTEIVSPETEKNFVYRLGNYATDILFDEKIISRIAKYCSDRITTLIADNLKMILFESPYWIDATIHSNNKDLNISAKIDNSSLILSISEKENPTIIVEKSVIENFEQFNEIETKEKICGILKSQNIELEEENISTLEYLTRRIINGSNTRLNYYSINQLSDGIYRSEIDARFALIFRELLNETAKQNPTKAKELLHLFAFDNKYRAAFYRKVVLYVVKENWKTTKPIFWNLLKNNDMLGIFSSGLFNDELYELLNKNQEVLTPTEIKTLNKIIDNKKHDQDGNLNYWKLRWYSALRDIEPFKNKYEKLSASINLSHKNFEHRAEFIVRSGYESPISSEVILQKSNQEIASFINTFQPENRWDGPNIEGLANELGEAFSLEPENFVNDLDSFQESYFIYIYHILNGFKSAWKNERKFDWEKVLKFCTKYIENEKFYSDKLTLRNDGWGANHKWIIGSICELLMEGMEDDKNAFDLALLPLAKDIIKILLTKLTPSEDFEQTNMDYPTYTLNSTAGKVLRTLIYYSLRRARNVKNDEYSQKWENEVKEFFELSLNNGIIDGFILLGWYFPQFNFLDTKWAFKQVRLFYGLEEKKWLAFIGGFGFSKPPSDKDIYILFYPHYERAIINKTELKNLFENGIIRHLAAFYFWDFENLDDEGLLVLFFNEANPLFIADFIGFISRQVEYYKGLNEEELKNFEEKIFKVWNYLANKYKKAEDENKIKILEELARLIVFVPQLNEQYTSLILKSSGVTDEHFHSHFIVQNLVKLKFKGSPNETAKYIGQILDSLRFPSYILDQQNLVELVDFLYNNNQKLIADKFCDKMASQGHEFLIEIYNKYNQ